MRRRYILLNFCSTETAKKSGCRSPSLSVVLLWPLRFWQFWHLFYNTRGISLARSISVLPSCFFVLETQSAGCIALPQLLHAPPTPSTAVRQLPNSTSTPSRPSRRRRQQQWQKQPRSRRTPSMPPSPPMPPTPSTQSKSKS